MGACAVERRSGKGEWKHVHLGGYRGGNIYLHVL